MNYSLQAQGQLLFRHEVLKARLDIRDFFLKNTVREIYENIGQVLSLVRMQLAMLDNGKQAIVESVESSGQLVGQSIKDLRLMCKSFYPDAAIVNEEGFIAVFRDAIQILFEQDEPVIKIVGTPKDIQPDLKLVVFKMMHDVLIAIKESGGVFVSLTIAYLEREVKITVFYNGNVVPFGNKADGDAHLTLAERAQLIAGKWRLAHSKKGIEQIQLSYPLKYQYA